MSQTSAYKISIRTGSADSDGLMLLDGGELVAIMVQLADECHGDARGKWVVESTFGLNPVRRSGLFPCAADAAAWISEQIGHRPFMLNQKLVELQ